MVGECRVVGDDLIGVRAARGVLDDELSSVACDGVNDGDASSDSGVCNSQFLSMIFWHVW